MSQFYEIRDPIHRTILLSARERQLVDHPWFQRLRHIRQLGFVSLVYPGAVHDRFQHSLGVMHLAGRCFDQLVDEQRSALADYTDNDLGYARKILRFAGLLHDVGHAPFSHTAEAYLPQVDAFSLPADWYRDRTQPRGRQASHEDCTLAVIYHLGQTGMLSEDEARDVAAVLSDTIRRSARFANLGNIVGVLRALVSGEVDADRGDYLLRDSHYTGVTYGLYDLDRLVSCLRITPGPHGPELGLDIHGVHVLEGLLMARYHMFLQVYFHKTPPAFEYFLAQSLAQKEISMSLDSLEAVMDLRDDHMIERLYAAAQSGGEWSRRIVQREPASLVMRERVGEAHADNAIALQLINELQSAGCHVFWRQSKQRFTKLAGAGGVENGVRLQCVRRVLGQEVVEPITQHSHLLSAFNQGIDLQHTYVLREDKTVAQAVMAHLQERS